MFKFNKDNNNRLGKVGPFVKGNLLKRSMSASFDEARQEWFFVRLMEGMEAGFSKHCELCGQCLYNENFIIENEYTQEQMKVGSTCIKRFLLLAGTSNQEDSNQYFKNKIDELKHMAKLKGLYLEVVKSKEPLPRYVNQFQRYLSNLLHNKGDFYLVEGLDNIKIIHQKYFGNTHPTDQEVMRIFYALHMPKKINRSST